MSMPRYGHGIASPRRPRAYRRHPLRPTRRARERASQVALVALTAEAVHGRRGEAAARRGDMCEARARLQAMDAHRAVALRWLRVAFGRTPLMAADRGEGA